MPFLGTTPTQGFVSSFPKQSFTPDGSTTVFTLTNPVATANDLEVFVGNVRQEPTTAYTAAGTTLTMTEAPASGLNFYVINKSFAQVTTTPPVNSITTDKIIASAVTDAKIASGVSASKVTTGTLPASQVPAGSVVQTVVVNDTSLYTNSSTSTWTEVLETTFTPISDSNKLLFYGQLGECDIATGRGFSRIYYGSTANQYSQQVVRICSEYGRGENYEAESHTGNIQVFSELLDANHNGMSGQRYYGIAIINQTSGTFRVGNGVHHKLIIMEIKS
tara:strand:+ start:935 stop:1762 length:828 start_codon:yes stop_codon:yes gene_type:complete